METEPKPALPETMRECVRRFAAGLTHPEHDAECSSAPAQVYAWIKEYDPELYARIREAIRAGAWRVASCVWVDASGPVGGGESLVRQLVYGQDFFLEEFGQETSEAVLTSGPAGVASWPQILRRAGFASLRLSPGQPGLPPVFLWEGIDGTRLLTRAMPPPEGKGAGDLPVWAGELCAKGAGDSCGAQARHKKGNRKSEFLLREAEFFDAVTGRPHYQVRAGVVEEHRAAYDIAARHAATAAGYLERAWKLVLLNQSRPLAGWHLDSTSDYAAIFQLAHAVAEPARHALAGRIDTGAAARPFAVFNPGPFPRSEVISLPDASPLHMTVPGVRLRGGGRRCAASRVLLRAATGGDRTQARGRHR